MTIGLEEDSRFYDGPIIDTRADVNATEKEESVVVQEKKEIEVKEEVMQTKQTSQKDETKEGETTFSYERDDE